MARFVELDEYLDDTMELPYRGTFYVVHAADADTGLRCTRAMNMATHLLAEADKLDADNLTDEQREAERIRITRELEASKLNDEDEAELYQLLLGHTPSRDDYDPERDVWQQLHDVHASWSVVKHFGTTAMIWASRGMADAMAYWESVKPQDPTPAPRAPQDRKPRKQPAKKQAAKPRTRSTTPKAAGTATP